KILDLALIHQLVEALHIALAADLKRAFDIDLYKIADMFTCPGACPTVRRDGGGDASHSIASKQATHEGDSLNIRIAVLTTKTQSFAEVSTYYIPIENFGSAPISS